MPRVLTTVWVLTFLDTVYDMFELRRRSLWFKMEFTGHRNPQGRDFDYHFLHGFGMPEHQFLGAQAKRAPLVL